MPKQSLICEQCGKKYEAYTYSNRPSRFCSLECWYASRQPKMVQYICVGCGDPFERVPTEDRPPQYCSLTCSRKHVKPPRQIAPLKTFICEQCGTEFYGKRHIKRKYCSKECAHAGRVGQKMNMKDPRTEVRHCEYCGDPFEEFISQARKFCGRECYNRWYSENLSGENAPNWQGGPTETHSCVQCGTVFHDYTRNKRTFCSYECKGIWQAQNLIGENNPLWQGGGWGYYYGPNWIQQRREARKRDGYRCCHCGITEKKLGIHLDVHHIIPFKTFGYLPGENDNYLQANSMRNLMCLCKACHTRAEHSLIPLQPKLV